MRIKYLGTAASEGVPALFCNCACCNEARRLGGKNIRTRSQAMINEDMLIDFPADTYHHFLQNGIEGDKIKYLLVTHTHPDHFYPMDLLTRNGAYAYDMRVPTLRVLCPKGALDMFKRQPVNVELIAAEAFKTVDLGEYKATPLPARHFIGSDAFIYIIEDGEKTILYAHDTGYLYDDVFSYIEKNKIVFDMVSMDCNHTDVPVSDEATHMGFVNIERVLERLSSFGAVHSGTLKYVNHFSHNSYPIHHVLEEKAAKYGYLVSFDGCEIML